MNKPKLEGKTAVVTGSGRGIGKAIALELASHGANIVLNGRNSERLHAAETEMKELGHEVISVCCDVATEAGAQLLVDEAIRAFSKIDILVNNVGVSMRGRFADLNPKVFTAMFESNILATVIPIQKALPAIRKSKGSIILISSLAGIRGLPHTSAYCAAKMSLRAIAESIRIEEADSGIHVGLVLVGVTEIDVGKETINADGSTRLLADRKGTGAQSKESVAKAVLRNIVRRKYISVLTNLGKLNYTIQKFFPLIAEKIIIRNISKFEDAYK